MKTHRFCAALAAACLLTATAHAQINEIPGTDVALGQLGVISNASLFSPNNGWHEGEFPNGLSALAMSTTSCNLGTVNVPWLAASGNMKEDHPVIAFLVVRERNGRLEQISKNAYVKHGFFALSNSQCIPCQNPSNGTFLGVGCSDTYGVSNNSDHFWLAPPEEIDPWLGTWNKFCSYFDAGLNPQPGPDCDGFRSLTNQQASSLGEIGHRINVDDQDLLNSNGDMWYQGYYVVRGEPEANRDNNLRSRGMIPNWTGNVWNIATPPGSSVSGTVLKRWDDSTLRIGKNGLDDGAVYLATKVTGPVDGMYHYELALHNRDNSRGIGEVRLPVCPDAQVENIAFRDAVGKNPWTANVVAGEIVWTDTSGQNALTWNNIYNFSFDSDAAPEPAEATMGQAQPGPGASSFLVGVRAPTALHNKVVGPGCSFGTPPDLTANGQATLGNAAFALTTAGHDPGAEVLWFLDVTNGVTLPVGGGCTLYMTGALGASMIMFQPEIADAAGASTLALPIPNALGLEGAFVTLQAFGLRAGGGPMLNVGDLSDGLQVRLGSATSGCQ